MTKSDLYCILTPEEMELPMSNQPARECGGCTACCFTHTVAHRKQPITKAFEWCKHCVQGSGCTIYTTRPYACQVYKCAWLGGRFSEDKRPDRWGIIIDRWHVPGYDDLPMINIWECIEGRFKAPDIQAMIASWIATGKYVIVGRPMNKEQHLHFPLIMTDEEKGAYVNAAIQALAREEDKAEAVV